MGIHCQLHIQNDKVIIYSDQGEIYTSRLPTMVKEAKAISKDHAVVFDLELEWWKGGEHQPREVTAGHFNPRSKEPIDDSEAVANVFDLLYDNEDIHKLKQSERLKRLESFKWPQSTIGKPNLKFRFNLVPYELVSTGAALKQKIGKYINVIASEGAMLKEDAPYSLTGASATIYKLKTFAEIHGIVWKKTETKTPNVWNYDYALSFTEQDKVDSKYTVEVKGRKYTDVGRSFSTAVDVPLGGIITIRFHAINLYTDPRTGVKHIGVYEPKFYEHRKGDVSPDSFSSAIKVGRDSGLLIEKSRFAGVEFVRKADALLIEDEIEFVELSKEDAEVLSRVANSNYRIITDGDRFILKQDPYLHLPPENKVYRYGIQHHFRRKSVSRFTPVVTRSKKGIDVLPIYSLYSGNGSEFQALRGLQVWAKDGWTDTNGIFRHRLGKCPLVRVNAYGGLVDVTNDHSLFLDGKSIITEALAVGQFVDFCSLPAIEEEEKVDLDFAWILGFFLAEGWHDKNVAYFGQNDPKCFDRVEKFASRYGLGCSMFGENGGEFRCSLAGLRVFQHCYSPVPPHFVRKKSWIKKVPSFVFNWNAECKKKLFEGYFFGDGIQRNGGYGSVSQSLLQGMLLLQRSLGVEHFRVVAEDRRDLNVVQPVKMNHSQTKPRNQIRKLIIALRNIPRYGQDNPRYRTGKYMKPVEDRVKLSKGSSEVFHYNDKGYVYDIETQSRSFLAGIGSILAHNSVHADDRNETE